MHNAKQRKYNKKIMLIKNLLKKNYIMLTTTNTEYRQNKLQNQPNEKYIQYQTRGFPFVRSSVRV